MLSNYRSGLKMLFQRLFVVALTLVGLKICFYIFNHSHFWNINTWLFIEYLFWGLRFDLSIVFSVNSLFILLSILPFPFIYNRQYQRYLFGWFIFSNSILYLIECADIAYFPFTQKRITADVFTLIGNRNDFIHLIPAFLYDYWYCIVLWTAAIAITFAFYKPAAEKNEVENPTMKVFLQQLAAFILVTGFSLIVIRGGIQHKPIQNNFAVEYSLPEYTPLILNSAFSLTHSINKGNLVPVRYMPDHEVEMVYNPDKKAAVQAPFQAKNVVIIILESFSTEYTGMGGRKSYTPFLDSLMNKSLVFRNAFSNGKRSNEGVPAVVSGIPTWMDNPYNSSAYSTNRINSIASLLKLEGYETAFFHGANNGSMYFDKFMKTAGFDAYYGRNEFNDDSQYDNNWGIWDEPFFDFFLEKMNSMKPPFCTAFFSLSSHHPFELPAAYKNKFPAGTLPIHPVIGYTDKALGDFFRKASGEPWFQHTLFVVTADHTGPSADKFYLNPVGNYRIPLLIYDPSNEQYAGRVIHTVTQQIDIMPTVLEYLHYPRTYFSFGNNALDNSKKHFALNFSNSVYQFTSGDYFMQFDGDKAIGLYHLPTDSMLTNNISQSSPAIRMELENHLKAVVQTYNGRLMQNRTLAVNTRGIR